MFGIKRKISIIINKIKWRLKNSNNLTKAVNNFPHNAVTVGNYSYGALHVLKEGDIGTLTIGHYCSIAPNVTFVLCSDHYTNHISSYPFKVKVLHSTDREAISKGDITLGDDVWIGCNSTIMSGVSIGQGAIVAAGAVVTKDVPPYAIVGGVPAKIIKYRFDDDTIRELSKIDYSKLTKKLVKNHIEELYKSVIDINQLYWLPKR